MTATIRVHTLRLMAYLAASMMALGLSSCEVIETQQLPERNWSLVWEDEFEGAAGEAPNPANWTYDIGRGDNGWGNEELQYYTDRPENVSLDGDGNLVITAIQGRLLERPFPRPASRPRAFFRRRMAALRRA